ncbi:hypothetical protein Tco_0486839 [Tanacetum coccineum]
MSQDFYNSNSSGFDQYQPPQSSDIHQHPQETNKEILQAREDLMEAIQAFLKEYDHIPLNEKCMALLLAEERFLKIKQAMEEEQNQPEVMQELLLKLMDDLQILKGSQQEKKEMAAQSFTPYWDFFSNKPKAITPDLLIEEPDNSLSMGDEHLDTIPCVENLVLILSEFKGISDDTCDVPVGEDSSTFDALSDHSEILSDSNNDGTSSDDDSYENIEYKHHLSIWRSRLITNIEYLKDNPTPDHVFKSSSSFPIHVTNSDSFFEKSDTSFSFSDNSLPEFETFSDFIRKETRIARLISIVISDNSNDPLLELPEFESFHFDLYDDPSFHHTPPEPPDVEISLIIETDAPVINNFDELNEDECFDPGGGEINVEVDDSFTFVTRTFLPYLTYPEVSSLLSSTKNEDTIFDPGIST